MADQPANQERPYTHAEERAIGIEMSLNPIMKEIAEATVRLQCDNDPSGFTDPLARERIRRLCGDEGAARWDQIGAKMMETLDEQTPGT